MSRANPWAKMGISKRAYLATCKALGLSGKEAVRHIEGAK